MKRNWGYTVFYATAFAVLAVIGLCSNSFFAYKFFDNLFFDILYFVLIIAVFIVLSIQNLLKQPTRSGKIFMLTYFNIFSLTFALLPFVSTRVRAMLLFICFVVTFSMLIVLSFRHLKAPKNYVITKFCPISAAVPIILLLALNSNRVYVNEGKMWYLLLMAGAVLSAIALFVFLRYFKNIDYFKQRKGEFIAAIIGIIFVAVSVALAAVVSVNYALDGEPKIVSVEIFDKYIRAGGRQSTSFNFKVIIAGKEKTIEVPVDIYHAKEVGDKLEIKLYKGALGYSYYIYERQ